MQEFWMFLENAQYFMTKDTADLTPISCSGSVANTLFREKQHHNQKGGSNATPKLGPVLEVATSYLHGKYGVEIRIVSCEKRQ